MGVRAKSLQSCKQLEQYLAHRTCSARVNPQDFSKSAFLPPAGPTDF